MESTLTLNWDSCRHHRLVTSPITFHFLFLDSISFKYAATSDATDEDDCPRPPQSSGDEWAPDGQVIEAITSKRKRRRRSKPPQRFHCRNCQFVRKKRQGLRIHESHHSDRPEKFRCDQCSYSVSSKIQLARHTNRVHLPKDVIISDCPVDHDGSEEKEETTFADLAIRMLKTGTEAVEFRLAKQPILKVEAELRLRKFQCAALEIQQQQGQTGGILTEAIDSISKHSKLALQAQTEEEDWLVQAKTNLEETIASLKSKKISDQQCQERLKEKKAAQLYRIYQKFALKRIKALKAFRKKSAKIQRDEDKAIQLI